MEINWGFELTGIILAPIIFLIIRISKSKFREEDIKVFNRIPRQYFFFTFAAAFFGVSIVLDLGRLFTGNFGSSISWNYLLPFSPALALYLKLRQATKIIESTEEKVLSG